MLDKNKSKDNIKIINNNIVKAIEKDYDDFWIRIGAKAGLLYYALYKELLKSGYKKVFFLARDGYNLYNLFKKYSSLDVEYLYTSKKTLLLASISKLDDKTLSFLPPYSCGQTVGEVFNYLGMKDIFVIKDLKSVGFRSFDQVISKPEDILKFKRLYRVKEIQVLDYCNKVREKANKYFEGIGLFDNDCLVFDADWNGSRQPLFEDYVHLVNFTMSVNFYYVGIFNSNQFIKNKYKAFLFDEGVNQEISDRVRGNIGLLDLFFSAPENSVSGYDDNGYILDDMEKQIEYREKIYKGINLYFERIIKEDKKNNFVISADIAMEPLFKLIEEPTLEEAIKIGDTEYYDNRINKIRYIGKLEKEDIRKKKDIDIYWRSGLLRRNDLEPDVKKFLRKRYGICNGRIVNTIIYGLRNPLLYIEAFKDKEYEIAILENGKSIKYEGDKDHNNLWRITAPIKMFSTIKIFLIGNDEKILLKTVYNGIISRLLAKIGKRLSKIGKVFGFLKPVGEVLTFIFGIIIWPFKQLFEFIGGLSKMIGKINKYLWKKYHLLVPINKWGEELTNIRKIICFGDERLFVDFTNGKEYRKWLKFYDKKSKVKKLDYNPLISFVIPVYNVSRKYLSECLDSILKQTYQNFEICLADDCSTNEETISTLKEYEKKDKRIKIVYRKSNGHISNASNSALELATGEYVAMMDNDDVIPSHALYELVKVLNEDKKIDLIYTDEDKLDTDGLRCSPHMKPDYSPDTLMSLNYFCHFTLLRTSILKEIGGWKVGCEGAQDWDLFLRFTEVTKNIYHLPKVLYHWRMIPGSTSLSMDSKNYVDKASIKVLSDALKRRAKEGIVHTHDKSPHYWIEYIYKKEPMVSIIIPTKDYASSLKTCLESIYVRNNYSNYEVIVVDNRSSEEETFKLFEDYKKRYKNFRVVKADMEFNYSRINNLAVKEAKGEYVLLLNNDIEVISDNWLNLMVGYAMQSHIGAVGAKLIYPDKTIQHGGILLTNNYVACSAFSFEPYESTGFFSRLCVPYNYSAVTAACLMIEKKKYLEVNGLEEKLKVAFNDVDFCLKLRKAGYYNVFLPMVELYHYESKSRGYEDSLEKKERLAKERKYMFDHWGEWISNDPMYNENLSRKRLFHLRTDNISKEQENKM